MQKLKVAAAIFGCVLALAALFVPAFALDPDYDPEQTFNTDTPFEPLDLPGGLLGDTSTTTAETAYDVIGNLVSGTKTGFTLSYIGTDPLVANTTAYNAVRSFLYDAGVTSTSRRGFSSGFHGTGDSRVFQSGPVYASSSFLYTILDGSASSYNSLDRLEVSFPDNSYLEAAQALDSDLFRVTENATIGKALGTQIWTFGDSLIHFVTSNFLVMIPIVIWLLVVAISAIKKIADPEV